MTNEKLYWIWLSSIPGIGARRFYKLLEYFESPRRLYEASKTEVEQASRILGKKCWEKIAAARNTKALEKAQRILSMPEFSILTLSSPEYPALLKTIYDPPPVLYCKGRPFPSGMPAVAVVGSRRCSGYGRTVARRFSCELAQAGVAVISGMARGIDTMAHKGALDAESGYTAAVFGCGVDVVYPPESKSLYQMIAERGSLFSEYPPGIGPSAGNFPARNRIISGLANGTLVIEAGQKSGALITVDFALEQGREVYAIPGNINSPYSKGTNRLLKEGARVVTSVEDILDDLNIAAPACTYGHSATRSGEAAETGALDFFETSVYNALEDGEKGLEELIQITNLPPGQLNAILTFMEIKGIIKQLPGKIFMKQWKA